MTFAPFRHYREFGSLPGLRLLLSPEALIWINHRKTPGEQKKQLMSKVERLAQDIREVGHPRRGKIKQARGCEGPVKYLRLTKDQRVMFEYASPAMNRGRGRVDIYLLAVSDKSNFQEMLNASSEHKVHAATFDELEWSEGDSDDDLDYSTATKEIIDDFVERLKLDFGALPTQDQEAGWTREKYWERINRATIYDLRLPHLKSLSDFDPDDGFPPILKLQERQEKMLEESSQCFLLEGVAGTGKTTMLLYRFAQFARGFMDDETIEFRPERFMFVTHNVRLKRLVIDLLQYFFHGKELEDVRRCVKSVEEAFRELVPKEATAFPTNKKLSRDDFRHIMRSTPMDTDLLWEEYRGVLRGYGLRTDARILSLDEYLNLGAKRGKIANRPEFYAAAERFESLLSRHNRLSPAEGGWDDLDLCRAVLSEIDASPELKRLDFLLIDEVQDLSTAELGVLLELMDPFGYLNVSAAGDLAQSVQPSAFTWESLKNLISEDLGVHPETVESLRENFRSTPYLVNAANHVLKEVTTLREESSNELQRAYSGENSGEPMQLMFDTEQALIDALKQHNLPNMNCVLLVRDEPTLQWLQSEFEETNAAFMETVARFKGLELDGILVWDPCSGSDRILDRLYDPNRGPRAIADEGNRTTGELELNHLFVGFTRARFKLGVCLPLTKGQQATPQHFFESRFDPELDYIDKSNASRIDLFKELEVSEETQRIRADDFVEARAFGMAAQVYRMMGLLHEYHFYTGEKHREDLHYPEAIRAYGEAVVHTGARTEQAREHIGRLAMDAIDDATSEQEKAEVVTNVRLFASNKLDSDVLRRIEGDSEFTRGNYDIAARHYLACGYTKGAQRCLTYIRDKLVRASILLLAEQFDEAERTYRDWILTELLPDQQYERQCFKLALDGGTSVPDLFPDELKGLMNKFRKYDFEFAKELAKESSDPMVWEKFISQQEQDQFLSKSPKNADEEIEQIRLLMRKRRYDQALQRINRPMKIIPDTIAHARLKLEHAQMSGMADIDVLYLIRELHQEGHSFDGLMVAIGEHWVKSDSTRVLDAMIQIKRAEIEDFGVSIDFDNSTAEDVSSQLFVALDLLAALITSMESNNPELMKRVIDRAWLPHKVDGRQGQTVLASASTMILYLILGVDPELPPPERKILASMKVAVLLHFETKVRRTPRKSVIKNLILAYSLAGTKFDSSPNWKKLEEQYGLREENFASVHFLPKLHRRSLVLEALMYLEGRVDHPRWGNRFLPALKQEYRKPATLSDLIQEAKEKRAAYRSAIGSGEPDPLPRLRNLPIEPEPCAVSELPAFVKERVRDFATALVGHELSASLWRNHIESLEASTMESFLDDVRSVIEKHDFSNRDDEEANQANDSTQASTPVQDEDLEGNLTSDEVTPLVNDYVHNREEIEDSVERESSIEPIVEVAQEMDEDPVVEGEDEDEELLDLLTGPDLNVQVSISSISVSHLFSKDDWTVVSSLHDNEKGEQTVSWIESAIEDRLPVDPKAKADMLSRAIESVIGWEDWPPHFRMIVVLTIQRNQRLNPIIDAEGVMLTLLSLEGKFLVSKFKDAHRGVVLSSGMVYAPQVMNISADF